jgi:hypothetical protein
MGKLEERLTELEYKLHELREEINVNYSHVTEILRLLKKKFPEEFEPVAGFNLKRQK